VHRSLLRRFLRRSFSYYLPFIVTQSPHFVAFYILFCPISNSFAKNGGKPALVLYGFPY
jgi:hypothetical protein